MVILTISKISLLIPILIPTLARKLIIILVVYTYIYIYTFTHVCIYIYIYTYIRTSDDT